MKKIGIFICSFNGREYVIDCINSLYKQSAQDFDIYVVDNASTDGTAEVLDKIFGNRITILHNSENLGGAGGFDRGLQHGLQIGYEYLVMLDNDIILDEYVIENLSEYLDRNSEVGIVGAKIYYMDEPEKIMDYGSMIDFDNFRVNNGYNSKRDDEDIPAIIECDFVPACAAMIRRSVLLECGTMPIDCFIYYDDIEMCHRFSLKGHKVVAYSKAKVWHKGGGSSRKYQNTFSRYYFTRNKWNFFAKYIPEKKIEQLVDAIISETFPVLYGCQYKGKRELYDTTKYIFEDFINNVRGKAQEGRINTLVSRENPTIQKFKKKECILIDFSSEGLSLDEIRKTNLFSLMKMLKSINPKIKCITKMKNFTMDDKVSLTNYIFCEWDQEGIPHVIADESTALQDVDIVLQYCKHATLVQENILPTVYWDSHFNFITDAADYNYYTNYKNELDNFKRKYEGKVIEAVRSVRENNSIGGLKVASIRD
ncbi:glycosyltransferase family 2 protein [Paenibacillus sp. LS1]|uniref:glycosyltransferase family 2 protein n=1 Tax=Paenibacillus sp. LS1 TaxID=2992120 RepID=UPI0022315DF9|nr:glycosyltransferase family 2 protein [Paenibacillus sp. LS1]MCW3795110.1 glycosyltransferase family 2 protein [Paenibacillus sp. LS1]